MNEAMPRWRSFGDGPQDPPEAKRSGGPAPEPDDTWRRWLPAVAAGFGGLVGGGLLVGAIVLTLGAPGGTDMAAVGEPLDLLVAPDDGPPARAATDAIVVDVAGAVARPGLHRLEQGDRVGDAIAEAGGFAPRADLEAASTSLNLAQPLEDGAKVLVPTLGNARPASRSAAAVSRIELNHATQAELESLPGIGPVTARKIIDGRQQQRFGTVRELRTRGLVGESVYADIKDRVTAG